MGPRLGWAVVVALARPGSYGQTQIEPTGAGLIATVCRMLAHLGCVGLVVDGRVGLEHLVGSALESADALGTVAGVRVLRCRIRAASGWCSGYAAVT
jgi:hypothetical protein